MLNQKREEREKREEARALNRCSLAFASRLSACVCFLSSLCGASCLFVSGSPHITHEHTHTHTHTLSLVLLCSFLFLASLLSLSFSLCLSPPETLLLAFDLSVTTTLAKRSHGCHTPFRKR